MGWIVYGSKEITVSEAETIKDNQVSLPIRVKHLHKSGFYNLFLICKMEMDTVSLYSLLKYASILSSCN